MVEMLAENLVIQTLSRWPAHLPEQTLAALSALPVPAEAANERDARHPLASIVIVTCNGLPFTKLCLHSLLANTAWSPYEVVLVDNGSQDGTASWLSQAAAVNPHLRQFANFRNEGFARAANRGLAEAKGELLVLLNNDTILTHGWLRALIRQLNRPGLGMVCPVTNRCGNEAEIEASYRTYGELLRFARRRAVSHAGKCLKLPMLSLFCAAWPRRVFEEVGFLDERFEIGTFEDDDYCARVRQAGYHLACADDCFIHHFGQVSFSQLGGSERYQQQLQANRRRFEEKWGRPWTPHGRRPDDCYAHLCEELRRMFRRLLPSDARALVVSKGDEELLESLGEGCSHFPQNGSGGYLGHHPADSRQAVAQLKDLTAAGAEYLIFPQTAFWWLEYYSGLRQYLEKTARLQADNPQVARIFRLGARGISRQAAKSQRAQRQSHSP